MTYLILSDIHANFEALEAVLAAAGHYDHALVLGMRERGGLSRGAARHEAIDARGYLLLDQVVQRALVHGPVAEGSHQRGVNAFEHG